VLSSPCHRRVSNSTILILYVDVNPTAIYSLSNTDGVVVSVLALSVVDERVGLVQNGPRHHLMEYQLVLVMI